MAEAKSFAKSVLQARETDESAEVRPAFIKERAAAQAFTLRLRFKNGRAAQGLPWALFSGYEWSDGGQSEQLTLLFSGRAVTVKGRHLWRIVEELDEGQLKAIHEHDEREIALLEHQSNVQAPAEPSPIIVRIEVEPDFERYSALARGADL